MATVSQRNSYRKLIRNGIDRYKGNKRKRDDAIIIIGPIGKFIPPDKRTATTWIGKYGMYVVVSYKKSRGQWIYGSIFRNIWRPSAEKLVKEAKGRAKSVYYAEQGTLKSVGKIIRRDFELRPPS
tara:strand:+ start:321 stop:695 length:375 start_codon:yes stop_codon:yes gene_type:complete